MAAEPLVVATKDTPPFVMFSDSAAKPIGPTVMMVESIGTILGRPIEWRRMTFDQMLEEVAAGRVDMAAGAISVTAERERIIDFSHTSMSSSTDMTAPEGKLSPQGVFKLPSTIGIIAGNDRLKGWGGRGLSRWMPFIRSPPVPR